MTPPRPLALPEDKKVSEDKKIPERAIALPG